MITYIDINIFDSPAQTLVNTVNTVGVMGKGVALFFKKIYPEMYREYHKLCDEKKFSIGMLYIYRTQNKIIVNFPTKKHWRNPSRIDFIEIGLKKLIDKYQNYGISSISFPQLGCGNGELNWEAQVQPVMEKYLKHLPIPVYIHIYQQGDDFIPERLDNGYARQVRLERQRISADQFWQDLKLISQGMSNKLYQLSLFGPKIDVQEEKILFSYDTTTTKSAYREDVEDLWNLLRIRGTISNKDIPESIRNEDLQEGLFSLLTKLDYIKPINIRKQGSLENLQGLQYMPRPEIPHKIDILV